jgi:predicted dienelactone hydrolase
MKHLLLTFALFFGLAVPAFSAPAGPGGYKGGKGPFQVKELSQEWKDAARSRTIPAKIYYPADAKGPCPVIIFSHGLGGSVEAGLFWGSHWAGHGYVSVHIQHAGSDKSIWKNSSLKTIKSDAQKAATGGNLILRAQDVAFTVTKLAELNKTSPLQGKLDTTRIGMSGHSFGGATTMAAAGQNYPRQKNSPLAVRSIKAAIAFSAPGKKGDKEEIYGAITIPLMVLTGTKDDSPINDTKAADRRIPFDGMKGPDKYLVIFNDGDHMVFGGLPRRRGDGKADAFIVKEVNMATTAFWDIYLKDDAEARRWLTGGGFKENLGAGGTFETK